MKRNIQRASCSSSRVIKVFNREVIKIKEDKVPKTINSEVHAYIYIKRADRKKRLG